ncbi:MAG: OmpA family protein [Saprospiraceae bacterium]|nr:MAG: outer membrane protein/peptidoglycan-associated (lipo)protein [Bacteroidetes bacterium OLB9]MCO6464661.1 OmpA family protein [Saprospiraceae bacterium]
MKVIKMIVLSVCFILGSQSTYAQEDDINSAENKAYSNFDFIAGTKTIFYDDFTAGLGNWKIIEFDQAEDVEPPQIKNIPNENGQWFKVPRRGIFYPIKVKELPEKFTIEFDMWVDVEKMSEMESGLILSIVGNKVIKDEYSTAFDENPQIQLDIHPSKELLYCQATKENFDGERVLDRRDIKNGWKVGKVHRISISRDGAHIKVYVGEKKFLDISNALPVKTNYTLILATNMWGDGLYLTNLKISKFEPTAAKFDDNNKFVTTAIYFNYNSAVIKPESWPALQQAANVIQSTKGAVMIVGHTDSDGNDAANLALSLKRAESVKAFLIKNFHLDASRLLIDGKGETQPVESNKTAEGRANNRRVEFVKQ